jgi:tetratricopeptide (TPR) repeat protein
MIQIHLKKAGSFNCLFFWCLSALATPPETSVKDNLWKFDPELQKVHTLILNLQTDQALTILTDNTKSNEFHRMYLQSLGETIEVLISEDQRKFEIIDERFRQRIKKLEDLPKRPEALFLLAELHLQRGFNFLNLGKEMEAVFAIRKANQLSQTCLKEFPDFIPVLKTHGVIQVMIGSVPDKYHFFMSLLGMRGSVTTGQQHLLKLRESTSSLSIEASVLYFTIKGLINQQHGEASKGLTDMLTEQPNNRLLLFLAINMMVKNTQSEDALRLIQQLDQNNQGIPMYYLEYLRGEILLQKQEYKSSILAFQKFISTYKSQNFKKDSYFKISLAYFLQNDLVEAKRFFEKAKITGRDVAEPDKYAARQLEEGFFPNAKLLKARFATDGGYFSQAFSLLKSVEPADLRNGKEIAEYIYRQARLAHKTNDIQSAKLYYREAIKLTGQNPWYFGANSALNMGYIAKDQKDYPEARRYFEMVLSFKKHEYKNSLDGKARSALEELPSKKSS